MSEKPTEEQPTYYSFPREVKQGVGGAGYTMIRDARLANYPGTHQMFRELTRYYADSGTNWIQTTDDAVDDVIAILDKYPVRPE